MIHYSAPPRLLRNVIPDVHDVVRLLEDNAPYTPLGGWYRVGPEDEAPTSPLWFQNDWVHADFAVEGADLFLHHEGIIEAAKQFYCAEVVIPKSIYVNVMVGLNAAGPAHTDNPRFQGRDRTNTPMGLLRAMLWSGLFEDENITQATSIWWMNDVEGGALRYWPEGPHKPPTEHAKDMANTALVGDNHGMFHQVGPVGPYTPAPLLVTSRAELAPDPNARGASPEATEWVVVDRGAEQFRARLDQYRVSVLWKGDVYTNQAEYERQSQLSLSVQDVADRFNRDLESRGIAFRFDPAQVDSPEVVAELAQHYPEAMPIDALPSIYDS